MPLQLTALCMFTRPVPSLACAKLPYERLTDWLPRVTAICPEIFTLIHRLGVVLGRSAFAILRVCLAHAHKTPGFKKASPDGLVTQQHLASASDISHHRRLSTRQRYGRKLDSLPIRNYCWAPRGPGNHYLRTSWGGTTLDWIGTGQSDFLPFPFEVWIHSQEKNWGLKSLSPHISVYRIASSMLNSANYSSPIGLHDKLLQVLIESSHREHLFEQRQRVKPRRKRGWREAN